MVMNIAEIKIYVEIYVLKITIHPLSTDGAIVIWVLRQDYRQIKVVLTFYR